MGGGRALCVWKRLLYGGGMCSLRMETPPLWVGNVLFTDGNAAARTFGRAHRRRPYHFSYGSVPQGCRRGARRWTTQEMDAGEVLADGQTQEMIAGEVLADGQT